MRNAFNKKELFIRAEEVRGLIQSLRLLHLENSKTIQPCSQILLSLSDFLTSKRKGCACSSSACCSHNNPLPGSQVVSQKHQPQGFWVYTAGHRSEAASTHLPRVLIFNPRTDIRVKGEVWSEVFEVLCNGTSTMVKAQRQGSQPPAAEQLNSLSHHARGDQTLKTTVTYSSAAVPYHSLQSQQE